MTSPSAIAGYSYRRAYYVDRARGFHEDARRCRRHGDLLGAQCYARLARRDRKRVAVLNECIADLAADYYASTFTPEGTP